MIVNNAIDPMKAATVKQIITKSTRGKWVKNNGKCRKYMGFADSHYCLMNLKATRQYLQRIRIRGRSDLEEGFDCDDFAYVLKGRMCLYGRDKLHAKHSLCIGIAWGYFEWVPNENHAVNWMIDESKKLYWIEPQNRTIYPAEECRGRLQLILG